MVNVKGEGDRTARGSFLGVNPLGNEHESHTYIRGIGDPYQVSVPSSESNIAMALLLHSHNLVYYKEWGSRRLAPLLLFGKGRQLTGSTFH